MMSFIKVKLHKLARVDHNRHAGRFSVLKPVCQDGHFRVGRLHPAPPSPDPPQDDLPRIFLGMPRGSLVSLHSAHTFYLARQTKCRIVSHADATSSAGLHNYNTLLAMALDRRDAGDATHFAMLHADVMAQNSGWLDILCDEMERTGCDVISAVVPIKAQIPDPPTSTAIGLRSDPWALARYIKTSDYERLPITFGPADVCSTPDEILLINIGMWLADLRRPWWDDFPGFQFLTRILRNESGGRLCGMASDDWLWSRWLDEVGADYRATFAVPLLHAGSAVWSNRPPAAV